MSLCCCITLAHRLSYRESARAFCSPPGGYLRSRTHDSFRLGRRNILRMRTTAKSIAVPGPTNAEKCSLSNVRCMFSSRRNRSICAMIYTQQAIWINQWVSLPNIVNYSCVTSYPSFTLTAVVKPAQIASINPPPLAIPNTSVDA